MKLYFMECGILRSQKNFFIAGTSGAFDVPVPYFLIEHEKGYVLFDAGHNRATLEDATKAVPEPIWDAYHPEVYPEGYVLNALQKAGVKPEDVVYHICSHLHFDHSGGIGLFPNAKYIVQRQELHYAYVPDNFMKNAYLREDFDKDVDWLILDGWCDNRYDVFGDGKLVIYYTPGHTPGHQSLLVNLEEDAPMLLAADACYTVDNLDNYLLSGLACDNSTYLKSLQVFNDLKSRGVTIVTGHDPDAWKGFKKYPECYK